MWKKITFDVKIVYFYFHAPDKLTPTHVHIVWCYYTRARFMDSGEKIMINTPRSFSARAIDTWTYMNYIRCVLCAKAFGKMTSTIYPEPRYIRYRVYTQFDIIVMRSAIIINTEHPCTLYLRVLFIPQTRLYSCYIERKNITVPHCSGYTVKPP